MHNASDPYQRSIADSVIAHMLEGDEFGNTHALARRYGLMYVIWNQRWFKLYAPSQGWQPYSGESAHTDHVHFSFSWDGAWQRTTAWRYEASDPNACRSRGDFDPAGRAADATVYRRSAGRWFIHGRADSGIPFGMASDLPCALDFNADGMDDVAVFRNGTWYILGIAPSGIGYGLATDIPVAADYDGDALADIAVYRPSDGRWYIRGQSDTGIAFGINGDTPLPGNYAGGGDYAGDEIAVWRPSACRLYIHGVAPDGVGYGQLGDVPAPGDYNGDGLDDIGVFRPNSAQWFLRGINDNGIGFGVPGDVPVPADHDGDGRADIAVFRPSNATWYVDLNRDGQADIAQPYGVLGDIAIPRRG